MKKLVPIIFWLVICAVWTPAQPNPDQAVQKAREQFSDIKNRSIELERMKRESYRRSTPDDLTLKFPLIKEDFEEIQKINSKIIRLTAAKSPVNYETIFKLVSKINNRAVRLRSNLFATESDSKKEAKNNQRSNEQSDIKTLSAGLDKAINSFVHNSIFQNINIVNSKDSLKAQNDLEAVINVSKTIKLITKN